MSAWDNLTYVSPADIERRSFEIIGEELARLGIPSSDPQAELVVKRVIHTTADFDYARTLHFSPRAVSCG